MRQRTRLILPAAGGLLALAIAGGAWLLIRQPWRQVQRLPDGRVLTLEGATYLDHRLVIGTWWDRLLAPAFPRAQGARAVGLPTYPRDSANGLVFWFSNDEEAYRRQPAYRSGASLFLLAPYVEVVDENGDTTGPIAWLSRAPGHEGLLVVRLDAFPRRGQAVRVRFYGRNHPVPAAEFTAPNPTPGSHPVWQAEPYPIRRQAGDLTCALAELVTGYRYGKGETPAAPGQVPATRATFRLSRGGRATPEWEPVAMTLADATGNLLTPWDGILALRGDAQDLYVAGALSPRETAWRLKVELSRTARARFEPGETWSVRGVRVPGARETTPSGAVATRQGVRLRFQELAGTDNHWYRPRVRVRVETPREGFRLTLLARDDRGRTFAGYGLSTHGRQQLKGDQCDFFLNLPPDSRTVDLTFALHRSRFVEFLAKPSRL